MISAIVMAAGKGTRMNSCHAKTLHKVLDKEMIRQVSDTLDKLDVDNKVIVVGYDGQSVMDLMAGKVEFVTQEPQLGTAHAVKQAQQLDKYEGKTLIINGDCPLISKETYQKLLDKAEEYPLVVLTTILDDPKSYGRIIRDEHNDVIAIVENKDASVQQKEIKEINAGIYCVDNQLLWQYLPEIKDDNAQHEFYITDLVKIFIAHGLRVTGVIGQAEELQGINSQQELVLATKYMQKVINDKWMSQGVTIVSPETTYIGEDVIIGQDTIIYPNNRFEGKTVIGSNNIIEEGCYFNNAIIGDNNTIISMRITDSEIGSNIKAGPNSHLRNGCKIGNNCRIGNYVEMKNTQFGDGSKCAHLTYVGDCTVGKCCNFGCGVVTVNYDGKNKFHSTIGDHVFVGSNVNIISPVTIQDYTVLAAGSTITDDVASGDMAIARKRQEIKPGYGKKYLSK